MARDPNFENKIKELIGIAIGEASMCWHITPAGIFDSRRAESVVERLVEDVLDEVTMLRLSDELEREAQAPYGGLDPRDFDDDSFGNGGTDGDIS